MAELILTARLDLAEQIRQRWFLVYSLIFGGLVAALFAFGLADSRVLGFTGLSRLLITYIQLSMAILPVFVLVTTVRSIAGDREAGVVEYMLSLPIGLPQWYWGRFLGRFILVFSPVALAMLAAVVYGGIKGASVPWRELGIYTVLLISLSICFLGIGFFISSLTRASDVAQGSAFLVWLVLLLFLDLVLLGVLIRAQAPLSLVVMLALANPLQAFRAGAMLMFDPQLVLLGPSAFVILDHFGYFGYFAWAIVYPAVVGLALGFAGYRIFSRRDLP